MGAIWNVINWNEISNNYKAVTKGKFDDWPALKDFHKVMSQTFHPSEEGNLQPIKERSGEMTQKADSIFQAYLLEVGSPFQTLNRIFEF